MSDYFSFSLKIILANWFCKNKCIDNVPHKTDPTRDQGEVLYWILVLKGAKTPYVTVASNDK